MGIKLNIGAGKTAIDGFTPIDRKIGIEAFPLTYETDSVDEIRCSHLLEHFSFRDAQIALNEWVRVLKPGAKIRLAVPDVAKVIELGKSDPNWQFYLMGGQTDDDDFHKSCWTEDGLKRLMLSCGLVHVERWESQNTDCAARPFSLNLEGIKATAGEPSPPQIKMFAVMGVPRFGCNEAWGMIYDALGPLRIPIARYGGVFWGQCMQRAFNTCVEKGIDWILAIDYDSIFTTQHISILCDELANRPEIDAIAAIQCRRGSPFPLLAVAGQTSLSVTDDPIKVHSAHFGLTLIRVDALKKVAKPWFWAKPSSDGEWGNESDKMDDDIWFWHQWRLAGNTVYVAPRASIGHLESMVAEFDENLNARHVYLKDWRKARGLSTCESECERTGETGESDKSSTPQKSEPELSTPCCEPEKQNGSMVQPIHCLSQSVP